MTFSMTDIDDPESDWADRAIAALRDIRMGGLDDYVTEIDGVSLLDKISVEEHGRGEGTLFYHLSYQCRDRLRAGGGLPWGA